jgi:hypothetical protein
LENLHLERIESLKAGLLASSAFCLADAATFPLQAIAPIFAPLDTICSVLIKLAIAAISGFLFGITYRYIVRTDSNSHLQEGAVLAFGLIRGLAPIENAPEASHYLAWGIFGVESLFCFFIARLALDLAFRHQWVKPIE